MIAAASSSTEAVYVGIAVAMVSWVLFDLWRNRP
jgi:hypothetical protein